MPRGVDKKLLFLFLVLSSSILHNVASLGLTMSSKLITISEGTWRNAAANHRKRIRSILEPGLTSRRDREKGCTRKYVDDWTALDPNNPVFNFLVEYYGIKGAKGPRRLGRWSPDPSLLLRDAKEGDILMEDCMDVKDGILKSIMSASEGHGGIFLHKANEDDMGGTLHLRGSIPILSNAKMHGILYNPALFYERHQPHSPAHTQQILKSIAPFQWFASILRATLSSQPVLHCFGMHEWAMQYHPPGAPPPPSAKYQRVPLRVSREVVNRTVERKGVDCTHVDALRFFAPAAGELNRCGPELRREEQVVLEQKGCVHAHMDLLKQTLKLQPFVGAELLGDVLEVAVSARKLDVEASPYDAREYGVGVVPVETKEGRRMYKERQVALMNEVEPVRIRLLKAYEDFMDLAFDEEFHSGDGDGAFVAPERLAIARPGSLPWKHNLIKT